MHLTEYDVSLFAKLNSLGFLLICVNPYLVLSGRAVSVVVDGFMAYLSFFSHKLFVLGSAFYLTHFLLSTSDLSSTVQYSTSSLIEFTPI